MSLRVVLHGRQKPVDRDAYDKILLDALTRAGLLTDDSARGLVGRVEVEFERGTADSWGTELTLRDV